MGLMQHWNRYDIELNYLIYLDSGSSINRVEISFFFFFLLEISIFSVLLPRVIILYYPSKNWLYPYLIYPCLMLIFNPLLLGFLVLSPN